ncbi:tRNA (adenosine(37)-N6)-dimethylallyltransferase MiaA [Robiginitalea aurantiaca]|uniref:tRNA dimethylallyltransferase n=1 Tax=Robiginitalea aurantiaca TaxID=3056915 RepID=A0ABT7WG89_9FLAO|nr:tRNA (adenosine(37)-N6)-dimethylallyltransferase MiaA [Robiginitalea aurantiaca]MDM9631938.1 tRNA (adenosine(37)-N6)-dimethylallyltransferase MiaA [Robiginitalea aurantiaca]
MDKYLISICGATGIGKTRWAIRLAQHYKTEILSADSRQFYREMRIGTAVPSASELEAVPHHFIQHKSILETYTVGDFQREALERIADLFQVHDHLILAGGSGLYLDAVTRGLDEFPEVTPGVREDLERKYREEGIKTLQDLLYKVDPEYHKIVDLQNVRRLVRALEICISSGKPYSSFLGKPKSPQGFKHIALGIDAPREVIYSRIDQRVDHMIEQGLLDEVIELRQYRDLNAMQTVGYQELFAYLDGEVALETAIENIKRNTRRFAKRQGTWFRRDPNIFWIPFDAPAETGIALVENHIRSLHGH